jgi:hypothetical protein
MESACAISPQQEEGHDLAFVRLTSWEIYKDRNAGIFKKINPMSAFVFSKIKMEPRMWFFVEATHLVTSYREISSFFFGAACNCEPCTQTPLLMN